MDVLACHNKHYGAQDEDDADDEANGEQLAKEGYADNHGGDGLEGSDDGGGRRTNVVNGYHHEHQRHNGGQQA